MSDVPFEAVLLKHIQSPDSHTLAHYQQRGGYQTAREWLGKDRAAILQTIVDSGLRGRGGAGFPTGKKWSFLAKGTGKPSYLVVNGDESEPGTFKDRYLIECDPHQLIEGVILSAYAIECHHAFIYMRGEFILGYERLRKALDEAEAAGFVGKDIFGKGYDLKITAARGAGAYICGEETGLLTSLEGDRGYPKLKPPFPAVSGLLGAPTIVNNVETICNVPHILKNGVAWFRQWGTGDSPGFKIFSISGRVNRPGNYEVPLGTPLRHLIDECAGGVLDGKKIRAVIPGGSSTPLLTGDKIDNARMDYESLAAMGTFLGSGGIIVLDESVDMTRALYNLMRFYHHESCGQCTPCREGTGWLEKVMERLYHGHGRTEDLALLKEISGNMRGRTICPLADAAAMPMGSFLSECGEQLLAHSRAAQN
ncbi:MAG: NADH-quinone oxidoreductase subunit NuoF [Leptospirales bacterium]|nr:NADH-quinone oxidoreductase subunit NuoF [Leptospirales bacterium]